MNLIHGLDKPVFQIDKLLDSFPVNLDAIPDPTRQANLLIAAVNVALANEAHGNRGKKDHQPVPASLEQPEAEIVEPNVVNADQGQSVQEARNGRRSLAS